MILKALVTQMPILTSFTYLYVVLNLYGQTTLRYFSKYVNLCQQKKEMHIGLEQQR